MIILVFRWFLIINKYFSTSSTTMFWLYFMIFMIYFRFIIKNNIIMIEDMKYLFIIKNHLNTKIIHSYHNNFRTENCNLSQTRYSPHLKKIEGSFWLAIKKGNWKVHIKCFLQYKKTSFNGECKSLGISPNSIDA